MADTKEEKVFVNTLMEPDLVEKLDALRAVTGHKRAQLIRLLVKNAYEQMERSQEYVGRERRKGNFVGSIKTIK